MDVALDIFIRLSASSSITLCLLLQLEISSDDSLPVVPTLKRFHSSQRFLNFWQFRDQCWASWRLGLACF